MRPARRQVVVGAVVIAATVLPPLVSRVAPGFLDELLALRLAQAAAFAAMALSLNLLMGYAGQISLGHGALLAVGAYTSGILTGRFGLPFVAGLAAAAVLGGAVAFVVGLPALRLRGLYLAITTLGLLLVMQESILQIPWLSRGSAGVALPRPVAGDFVFTRNADFLALVLVVVIVLWLVDANVTRTRLGRAFRGLREDEQVAASRGVDVARHKLLAFLLSGAMAGVAGCLHGHLLRFVDSRTYDLNLSLLLVAVVVIGGLGSRLGVVLAGVGFGLLPEILRAITPAAEGWDHLLGAALLIVAMARHPEGVAGAITEARHAKAARQARAGVAESAPTEIPRLPELPRPAGAADRPAVAPGEALLEVRDLTVRFGGLTAVDHASISVPAGRIVGLIGPNGAGKTTLFNAVGGFVRTASGTVHLGGQRIDHLPPHERAARGLGRTFQRVGLARDLSVRENLLLSQHAICRYSAVAALGFLPGAARTEAEAGERADLAIAAIGFERFADMPAKHLSGGMQRIVEMACALVTAPELLLLDEPSAGMAPGAVENLAIRLRDLRDALGRTLLLVEHNVPLVLDVCDEIWVLHAGRVIAHGTPDEISRDPTVVEAYLGRNVPAEPVS